MAAVKLITLSFKKAKFFFSSIKLKSPSIFFNYSSNFRSKKTYKTSQESWKSFC